jgi:hypothetical protein
MGDMHRAIMRAGRVPTPLVTISAEEFEREWDKIWPDTDSADLAVRVAGLAARR